MRFGAGKLLGSGAFSAPRNGKTRTDMTAQIENHRVADPTRTHISEKDVTRRG
jgi:hypothetical protein